MTKKRSSKALDTEIGKEPGLYTRRASALPQLDTDGVNADRILKYRLDDLVLLRDLYQSILNGNDVQELPRKFGEDRSKCYKLLELLPMPDNPSRKRQYKKRVRQATDPSALPEVIFHDGLRVWLDDFVELLQRAQRGYKSCRVRASEFSILYLLPQALRHSAFLSNHPDVELDIAPADWQVFIHDLVRGRADLAIGPAVPPVRLPGNIAGEPVLRMRRALIGHAEHYPILTAAKPCETLLNELRYQTVFVLSGDRVPLFPMRQYLPLPEPPGRWIYVDSISHMYAYVKQGLGLALGYEKPFGLDDSGKDLKAVEFPEDILPQAVICLFHRSDVSLPAEVSDLATAIRRYASSLAR